MDKQTLSNYGWVVILVLILSVLLALATPFGTFVTDAIKSTTAGFFSVNQSALNSTGLINIGDQSFEDGEGEVLPTEPEDEAEPLPNEPEWEEYIGVYTHDMGRGHKESTDSYDIINFEANNYYVINPLNGEKILVTEAFYTTDRGRVSMEYLPKSVEGVPVSYIVPFEADTNWSDGRRTHSTYTKGTNVCGIESYIVIYDYYDADGNWSSQSDHVPLWKLEGDTFRLWTDTDTLTDGSRIYKDGGQVLIRTALDLSMLEQE